MAQTKKAAILQSWDEVNEHLREMGEIDLRIEEINADLTRRTNELKADAEEQAQPLIARRKRLEGEIQEFVAAHRDELQGKSRQLNFGRTGFRRATSIVLRNVNRMIELLKERHMHDCIIVKESVNRTALERYSDETLKAVGATRRSKENFFIEIDREKIQAN